MNELKPCPFCYEKEIIIDKYPNNSIYYAVCTNCNAQSTIASRKETVVKLWNTRKREREI